MKNNEVLSWEKLAKIKFAKYCQDHEIDKYYYYIEWMNEIVKTSMQKKTIMK